MITLTFTEELKLLGQKVYSDPKLDDPVILILLVSHFFPLIVALNFNMFNLLGLLRLC